MLRFTLVLALTLCVSIVARAEDEFYATRHSAGLTPKWREIQARMSEDGARLSMCRADADLCRPEDRQFSAILDASRQQEGRARIGHINRAVNLAIRPLSDLARFGGDRWSAPMATLQDGGGDCEDYAILKFMMLREAGIPDSELRLLIVRQAGTPAAHAVLAVRIDGEWVLLDNRRIALVRRDDSPYQVLSELAAEPSATMFAGAAISDLPPLL